MDTPLVSVVIPTYNRDLYLREAIASVTAQTYSPIEIIVVDDGSERDYASAICSEFDNCQYFYKENGGLSSARNFGIAKSKGDYIAFLDDDDYWREDKIAKQVAVFNELPEINAVHSAAAVVDEEGRLTGKTIGGTSEKAHKRSGYVFWNALGSWVMKSPTPLIKKSVFTGVMLFDESIKVGEDLDFYQRLFYKHQVHYLAEPLAFYRVYKNSKSLSSKHEKYVGVEWKTYVNLKKMGIRNPFALYKIALQLAKSAKKRWEAIKEDPSKNRNNYILYLHPWYFLRKYSKI